MKETIKQTLRKIGLTERESDVYILLGKSGPLKSSEITKQLRINKGQVFRTLKSLQKKGLIELTLEYPTRYTSLQFMNLINSYIKTKQEELNLIEENKKNLLIEWEKISQTEFESSIEKFSIIEGKKNIFHKISQMIKETNNQLSMILAVSDLIQADHFQVFDIAIKQPSISKIKILTKPTTQNLRAIKTLIKKLNPITDFRGTNPNLGSAKFSRMVIRDNEESIMFLSDNKNQSSARITETCLWTNCKSIINSFFNVFEDLWHDSIDIEQKIKEIETGKPFARIQIIKDSVSAKNQYIQTLNSAKKEILIVTSSTGLTRLSKNNIHLESCQKNGAIIRILAPIINTNLVAAQKLLQWVEVKHISLGFFPTTIIDDQHLFQFMNDLPPEIESSELFNFENTFYTNDTDHIQKTKKLLFEIWRKTRTPSLESLRTTTSFQLITEKPSIGHHSVERKTSFMNKLEYKKGKITEKDVKEKIKNEKKNSSINSGSWSETIRYFGCKGLAAIYPPANSKLPDMIIGVIHHDKKSTFGLENWIYINIIQKKKRTINYTPVAIIQDNAKSIPFRKKVFEGYHVADNIMLVDKNEIQVRVKGNTLIAGWTKPISLRYLNYILPPACLLLEGYGDVKSGIYTNTALSGRRQEIWHNSFDAFSTFFLPQLKHVGSGTEAFFERETLLFSKPPKLDHQP